MNTNEPIPATVTNIRRALAQTSPIKLSHRLVGTLVIDAAKAPGFGSKAVMVKLYRSNGWTLVDPVTWEITA